MQASESGMIFGRHVFWASAGCHSQNVGASILTQIGLADLIATNEEEYVRIAVELSNDPERLQRIKSTLRKTCLGTHSPCCFQPKGIFACSLVPCLHVQSQIHGLEMTASPA